MVVPHYFHGDKRPSLVSPEGAPLDPTVVDALTGHSQYAQAAGANAAGKVVGHVAKMTGSASIVRNGVTIVLNNGDAVYQSDVVQTGSNSTLGLVLVDGTTFNLTANARLMLNDLTYDPTTTSNTSLYTLVQGAASFVAGQVAKTGDMKVATPGAVIGIRGTSVILDISSTDGTISISVVDQQDGQTHAVQVFNTRGDLIGTVSSNGTSLTLTPTANFEVIAQESNKSPAQIAQEFNAFQQVLSTYDTYKAIAPNTPPPSDGRRGDANPQLTTKYATNSVNPIYSAPTSNIDILGNAKNTQTSGTDVTSVTSNTTTTQVATGGTSAPSTTTPDIIFIAAQQVAQTVSIPFVVSSSTVTLISASSSDHFDPVMSADGRFVTYDPVGAIFLFDRQSGTTSTIASPGAGFTYSAPSISADGNTVIYQGSNGTQSYIFVYGNNSADPAHYHQQTLLGPGSSPEISGDGSTIIAEEGGTSISIFNQLGQVIGSITPAAVGSSGTLWKPAISADGHLITFWSSNSSTAGGAGQLFAYNISTGAITSIATTSVGAGVTPASISADGHYIAYQSETSAGHSEIYLYDTTTGQVIFQTANAGGSSYNPVISPDGHYIVFASDAQLTSDDTNSYADTYVVDVTNPSAPVYKLVSALADGTLGNAASNLGATISSGGLYVAFGTSASNFSTSSSSGGIFVVDPTAGHSVVIEETASSPSILSATGSIAITGGVTGVALSVSDPSKLSAEFSPDGQSIVWSFNEAKSDFASLPYGQTVSQVFNITLSSNGGTTTVPVVVTVENAVQPNFTPADAPPVPNPVTLAAGVEDTSYIITQAALLKAVGDVDGPSLSITAVTIQSGGGTLVQNADQTWTYTPDPGFTGAVVFNYTASDTIKSASSTASLDIVLPLEIVAIAPDSGTPGDFITNSTNLTVTGTNGSLAAGDTTQVSSDNGVTWTDVVQTTTTTWSLVDTTAHSTSFIYQVRIVDSANNVVADNSHAVTIDTTAPSGSTPVLASASDSGVSSSDHITNVLAPTFTVALGATVAAGDTVQLLLGGSPLAHPVLHTVTVADISAGSVSLAVTAGDLGSDGSKAISAQFSDLAGNSSTTSALSMTLDTTAPVVTIGNAGGLTNQASPTIGGTVDVADAGATVTVLDGSTPVGTAIVQGDGNWSTSVTLNSGSNSLTAEVADAAGNSGLSNTVTYTLNTTAPTGGTPVLSAASDSGTSHTDGITDVTAPSFTVALGSTVVAGDTVQLLLGGSALAHPVTHIISAAEVTAGSVSLTVTAGDLGADGSKQISAQFSDGFGNSSTTAALTITLDTTAPSGGTPVLSAASDSGASHTDGITDVTAPSFTVALGPTVAAGDTVQLLLGGSALAHPVTHTVTAADVTTGSLSLTVTAGDLGADGSKSITAQFSDAAGNSSTTAADVITLDTAAPVVAIGNPGGPTNQPSLALTGTIAGADAGTTIAIFDGTTQVGVATISGSSWSANVTLSNGSNPLTAQVSDAAGNISTSAAVTYTLNTTAPTGGTPVLSAASDSGTSHTDGITDVTAPSFTVALGSTVVAGDTVQLLLGGSALAHPVTHIISAAEVTAGSVSLTVTAGDLGADGSKQISAQFSDGFGNSSTTAALTITLDTTAPSGGTPVLSAASDSGASHTDGITDVTAPSFTVALGPTVAAGDTVQLLLGGSALAHPVTHTVTAADVTTGSLSLTVTAGDLGADGSKSITAQFSDAAGNSSTTAADVITLDTAAPVVAIGNPGGPTNQPSLALTGTIAGADAGTTIAIFDGTTQVGVATISGSSWSANVTLSNGSNPLTAQVSDAAGNISTSAAVTYTLNTTAPTGGTPVLSAASDSGTSHTDGITDVTAPSFTVALGSTVVAGDTVQLLLGGSALAHPVTHIISAAEVTAGSVSLTVTAGDLGADGSKQISAQFSDGFGNSSTTAALTITLDTTAPSGGTPVLSAASDSGASHTDGITDVTAPSFTVALGPTVAAGDTVQLLLGGSALAHPVTHTVTAADVTTGSLSLTVTAGDLGADGSKSITAQFSDAAGNSSTTAADVITLDTAAPVVAIGNPGGPTNQPSLALTGTIAGADAGTTIAIFDGTTQVGVATISGSSWSANVTLSNGSNPLTAQVSDAAGNISTSAAVTYTLNTTAPTGGTPVLSAASDSGTSHTDGITDVTAPSFTVALGSTVVAGDTVQLLLGGSALAHPVTHIISAAEVTAGSVSLTVTAGDLGADGSKQISAQFSDGFGNSSTTAALTITLDTTAPSGGTPVLSAASDFGASHTDGITDVTAPSFTVALGPTVAAGDTVQLLLGGSALAHPVTHTVTAADVTTGSLSLTVTAGDLGADGSKSITAQFSDAAGNSSTTAADVITLDTAAPVVAIGNPGGPTNQPSLALTGTIAGADAGTTIAIFDGTTQVGVATISGSSWSANVTLSNGSNPLTAQVSDAAGNISTSAAVTYTLNTTAPTGGTPVLSAASDSGTSHTDGITDVTAPSFTVALGSTVVAGDTVQLLLGGSALAHPVTHIISAAEVTAGSVSLTVTAGDLGADGSKQISAQFSDGFGNSSTTAALTITLDTTAPSGGTPVLSAASDSGASHTDGITDVTAPSFTVALGPTVAAGDTVQLLLGGSALAHPVTHTVTAADVTTGSLSLTVTAGDLGADGSKSITAQFSDAAGNSSTTAADVITLDTAAPVVAIGNPGGPTNQPSLALTGTIAGADAGTTIAIFDGTTQVGVATISGSSWSANVTLSNGSNPLTAQVSDAAGNISTSAAVTYTLNTTAPTGGTPVLSAASDSGTSHTDGITDVTAPSFTVALGSTVVAGDTVQLLLGGSALAHPVTHIISAAEVTAGSVSLTVTAGDLGADGSKQISAQFSDGFGNSSTTAALTITLDTTAPSGGTPVLSAASDFGASHTDGITDVTAPSFTVALGPTVAAGDTVQLLLGGSALAHPVTHTVTAADVTTGSLSLTVTAGDLGADGSKSITAQFSDAAGNSSTTAADVITLDTAAPVVAIGNPGGPTNQPSLALTGTIAGADAGTTIAIFDGTTQVGVATISGSSWSANVTLSNGSNPLTAQVSDAAGNISTSAAVTFNLTVISGGWGGPFGGSWNSAANWSSGTVPGATTNVVFDPVGAAAPYVVTIPTATLVTVNSITLNDPDVTLLDEGMLTIAASLVETSGIFQIANGGTLSLGGGSSLVIDFSGTGGNLVLGSSPGFTGTIDAVSTATGAITISGIGAVTTSSGDAIDLQASGGTPASPATLGISLTGAITGAATGISGIQNGYGAVSIVTTGAVIGNAGDGILAEDLNASDNSSLTVDANGNVSGSSFGIYALTDSSGLLTVAAGANVDITGQAPAIQAVSAGVGNVSVTTATGDVITSNSDGINANSQATAIPFADASTIVVTAYGTIDSGPILNTSGTQPAGILAGYRGGTTNTTNPNVFGSVTINNYANITATGGDGIRGYNYGVGDITITDEANTTVVAPGEFGIREINYGPGNVTVTTSVGDFDYLRCERHFRNQ